MRDLLFDTPWWLLLMLGVAGVVLLTSGNARQSRSLVRCGIAVLLFAVLLGVMSYLIDTPKEKAIKGTRAVVNAAVNRDGTALASYLHPNATLVSWNRQQIIDGAVVYAERFGLKSATITGTTVREQPTQIVVTIRVVSRFESSNMPVDTIPTDWQMTWWEMPDGKWLLKDITPLGGGNVSGSQLSNQYFHGAAR